MAHCSRAIDEVRAQEAKTLKARGLEPVLTKTRWLLLKRPENLSEKQETRLAELLRYNLRTVRSYLLKENFQFFWISTSPYPASPSAADGTAGFQRRARLEGGARRSQYKAFPGWCLRDFRSIMARWSRCSACWRTGAGRSNGGMTATRQAPRICRLVSRSGR